LHSNLYPARRSLILVVSHMRTQVRFQTKLFKPLFAQSDQLENGRELAEWLCVSLPKEFNATAEFEDWGYRIYFGNPSISNRVTLCCGYVEKDQWSCFGDIHRSFTDKIFGRSVPTTLLEPVIRILDNLLASEPRFTDIEWFENDSRMREFKYGKRAFS
jgi:hypothetical protein